MEALIQHDLEQGPNIYDPSLTGEALAKFISAHPTGLKMNMGPFVPKLHASQTLRSPLVHDENPGYFNCVEDIFDRLGKSQGQIIIEMGFDPETDQHYATLFGVEAYEAYEAQLAERATEVAVV